MTTATPTLGQFQAQLRELTERVRLIEARQAEHERQQRRGPDWDALRPWAAPTAPADHWPTSRPRRRVGAAGRGERHRRGWGFRLTGRQRGGEVAVFQRWHA
jgi:hypothetical protein